MNEKNLLAVLAGLIIYVFGMLTGNPLDCGAFLDVSVMKTTAG